MKKIAYLLFNMLMVLCLTLTAQTTYYYKLTNKKVNGVRSENVSGGQFITINKDVCYESDKDGFSVKHGQMDYIEMKDGFKLYVGGSYYGTHTTLLFKSDFSSFRINTDDGDVYEYTRATPPAGVTTCSLIRKTVTKTDPIPQPNPQTIYPQTTYPQTTYQTTYPQTTTTYPQQQNPQPQPSSNVCSICLGRKVCTAGPNSTAYSSQYCEGDRKCHECRATGVKNGHTCTYCNGSKICGSCNGTGQCSYCHGTGKQ